MIVAIQTPSDGFEKYEQIFLKETVINMYRKIPDHRDKFIIMAYYDLGFTEDEIAKILKVSQIYICQKIKQIRTELKKVRSEIGY